MKTIKFPNGSRISAETIEIGKDFKIGANVKIEVRNTFRIGDFGRFGDNVEIVAESVKIGKHFFHYTPGLRVGGGGSQFFEANLIIGDRCVVHNNYINLARWVKLGNDVGLSPDVDIITHGFWQSVLEGYPTSYKPVEICDGVIVGQRSFILPGAFIAKNVVIGANSTVSGYLSESDTIYAGSPAKFIRKIVPPNAEEKKAIARDIVYKFCSIVEPRSDLDYEYPIIGYRGCTINLETQEIFGEEDIDTDKLRDFLRRYGIRIYTERPFVSL